VTLSAQRPQETASRWWVSNEGFRLVAFVITSSNWLNWQMLLPLQWCRYFFILDCADWWPAVPATSACYKCLETRWMWFVLEIEPIGIRLSFCRILSETVILYNETTWTECRRQSSESHITRTYKYHVRFVARVVRLDRAKHLSTVKWYSGFRRNFTRKDSREAPSWLNRDSLHPGQSVERAGENYWWQRWCCNWTRVLS
jgi:hypothetical protein